MIHFFARFEKDREGFFYRGTHNNAEYSKTTFISTVNQNLELADRFQHLQARSKITSNLISFEAKIDLAMADEKAPDTQKVESKDVAKPGDDASAEPKAEVNGTAAEAHKGSEPENNNKPEQPAEKKPTQIPVRQYLEGTGE